MISVFSVEGLVLMPQTILIVEDDPDIADLIEIHLKDIGYELDRAEDGAAGIEMALGKDYALVILDVMLPEVDGLDVCRRIRETKKRLPIVMLTSKSEELDKVLGLELGADDYITKPFSIREFIARIRALLRRASTDDGGRHGRMTCQRHSQCCRVLTELLCERTETLRHIVIRRFRISMRIGRLVYQPPLLGLRCLAYLPVSNPPPNGE